MAPLVRKYTQNLIRALQFFAHNNISNVLTSKAFLEIKLISKHINKTKANLITENIARKKNETLSI